MSDNLVTVSNRDLSITYHILITVSNRGSGEKYHWQNNCAGGQFDFFTQSKDNTDPILSTWM